jgi:uncharacterized protein involved in exopolysaccharide biosynthesis
MRHWLLTLVLVVLGALGGAAFSRAQPTTYTAEERLAVGGGDLAAQAVPGFALASQELASNYARFVTAGPVRSALPAATARRVLTVTASPVPESNVIRVEVTATDPGSATVAAAQAGERLVAQVDKMLSQQNGEQVRQQYRQISQQVAVAQQAQADAQDVVNRYRASSAAAARRALPAAKDELISASAKLADLQMQQTALAALYQNQVSRGPSENKLAVVSAAAVSGDDVKSRLELYGLGGAAAGGILAVVLVAAVERRRPSAGRRAVRGQLASGRPATGVPAEALLRSRHLPSQEDAAAASYPPAREWAGRGEHAAAAGAADGWDVVDLEGRRAWTARR